ncbi:MAG TPA: hypothetical protein VGZ26_12960 [Pirellulales bacterium]|jgi:hypothetical protein|nr:hypothetical protein [Pirellulales bacterium]
MQQSVSPERDADVAQVSPPNDKNDWEAESWAADSVATVTALPVKEFVPPLVEASRTPTDDYRGGGRLAEFPSPWRHPFHAIAWAARAAFGIVSLIVLLALLAAIPIVNFLVLGYLLEAEGGVARGGRLRRAFPLLSIAPRLGSIVLGIWLWLLPLRFLANVAADARLIDPTSRSTRRLDFAVTALSIAIALHLCLALARGGSVGCFLRPIKNARWALRQWRLGGYADKAAAEIRAFVAGLRLRYHFWLGVRGAFGAFAWLVVPTALFAFASKTEGKQIVVTILGGFLLVPVLAWLPFLQARFASENRFRGLFELREVRRLFSHAPFAWLLAVVATYVLALPLYLLKIFLLPQDAMWFVTLVFILSIYPARLVTGWAYGRALRREQRAGFLWRWSARLLLGPLLVVYVFLLFFTQFIGQHGKGVLFEHHAFLVPAPFWL